MSLPIVIGATSFLGHELIKTIECDICNVRFESAQEDWLNFANNKPATGHVILLSRSCRKTVPRRTRSTMLNEVSGISKILTAFPERHFIFASTKVIYGIVDEIRTITRKEIVEYFSMTLSGQFINTIVNLPEQDSNSKSIDDLSLDHQIYAHTKLCNESLIKYCAKSYTIFRIWDII